MRIGISVPGAPPGVRWQDIARRVESSGFDTLLVPDHLGPQVLSPLPAAAVALEATSELRVGTLVLNNALRDPLMVARESATLDALSGGRFELGIGAGYVTESTVSAGVALRPARERVARLEESVRLIQEIWRGEPASFDGVDRRLRGHQCTVGDGRRIPLLVGGNGRGVLGVAARHADAVGFVGVSRPDGGASLSATHLTYTGLREQLAHVRAVAGQRATSMTLSVLVQEVKITNDVGNAASQIQRWLPADLKAICDSPYLLLGTRQSILEQIDRLRTELGIGYLTVLGSSISAMEAVMRAS